MNIERAVFGLTDVKMLSSTEESGMCFEGYGAVFNNMDSEGDVIVKGAFEETLSKAKMSGLWPSMLAQHGGMRVTTEDLMPIGVWTDMYEDDTGLKMFGTLANTQRGREAYELLKMSPRPAINGLSIGYVAKAYEPRSRADDPKRKLTKIDLFEVSLVTFPANSKARVSSVKSELTVRDAEAGLRDAGFSREAAKTILASGFKGLMSLRDAGDDQTDVVADIRRLINKIS